MSFLTCGEFGMYQCVRLYNIDDEQFVTAYVVVSETCKYNTWVVIISPLCESLLSACHRLERYNGHKWFKTYITAKHSWVHVNISWCKIFSEGD